MVYDQNYDLVDLEQIVFKLSYSFAASSTISQKCVGRETIVPAR